MAWASIFECSELELPDIFVTIQSATRKSASAVPSLKRLSPSKIRVRRFGAPSSLKRASTATGSVAEIRAQNKNVTARGTSIPTNESPHESQKPMNTADTRSDITASAEIDFTLRKKSLYPILYAASKRRMGRNI